MNFIVILSHHTISGSQGKRTAPSAQEMAHCMIKLTLYAIAPQLLLDTGYHHYTKYPGKNPFATQSSSYNFLFLLNPVSFYIFLLVLTAV